MSGLLWVVIETEGIKCMWRIEGESTGRGDWNWGKLGGRGRNLAQWKLLEIYEGDPSKESN